MELLSIKIDKQSYDLLKKIKQEYGVPMTVSLKWAVEEYAKERGIK